MVICSRCTNYHIYCNHQRCRKVQSMQCQSMVPTVLVGVGEANSIKRDSGIKILVCTLCGCPGLRYLYIT